ncbi:hypothetical protein NC651_028085 [Populus alba x Populus x berolinensis]|nr:hypothetical protein NC651_028085 [Populus alba x Populus x berolinensis]
MVDLFLSEYTLPRSSSLKYYLRLLGWISVRSKFCYTGRPPRCCTTEDPVPSFYRMCNILENSLLRQDKSYGEVKWFQPYKINWFDRDSTKPLGSGKGTQERGAFHLCFEKWRGRPLTFCDFVFF